MVVLLLLVTKQGMQRSSAKRQRSKNKDWGEESSELESRCRDRIAAALDFARIRRSAKVVVV